MAASVAAAAARLAGGLLRAAVAEDACQRQRRADRGIDGIAATRKIRESEAQHPSVPPVRIVALTANAGPSTRAECISAGMNNFLTKPFTMRSLAGALAIPSMNATS